MIYLPAIGWPQSTDPTYTDSNLLFKKQILKYFALQKERNATNQAT